MTNEQIADEICNAVIKECGPRVWVTVGSDGGMEFKDRIVKALAAKDAANSEQAKMEWAIVKMAKCAAAGSRGERSVMVCDDQMVYLPGYDDGIEYVETAARAILNQKGTK